VGRGCGRRPQKVGLELTDQFNRATDGTVAIDAEYLLVVARKP
jgi:hypothetical protein